MTYLDDYEAQYKMYGVQMVSDMLDQVPPELLRRTGLDELIRTSLSTALYQLRAPETPTLVSLTVPTTVKLITKTSPLGSQLYFDQLCHLLGEGIIGTVWLYGPGEEDVGHQTMVSSYQVLPVIVQALGIGTVRFLKALIPHLTETIGDTTRADTVVAALGALRCVMQECHIRVGEWKGTILTALAKCWVIINESETQWKDQIGPELKRTWVDLCQWCPSVVKDEYARLLQLDRDMFQALNE